MVTILYTELTNLMKLTFKEYKKRAVESLSGKWKISVLGHFIPFIIFMLILPSKAIQHVFLQPTTKNVQNTFSYFGVSVVYAFLSFAFTVGISGILLLKSPKDKPARLKQHFILITLNGLRASFLPVMVTNVLCSFLTLMFSTEMLTFIYDNVFFTVLPYYTFLIIASLMNVVVNMLNVYVNMTYIFVPCLLADNPFLKGGIAMKLSRRIVKGHRVRIFFLSLSLIGWYILGACALFVGIFFAMSYSTAVVCEYYKTIRPHMNVSFITPEQKTL